MEPARRAVIDVGTNSVKLLVADVTGCTVHPVWEGSRQTRLGQGLFKTHRLDPRAIKTTAQTVADFSRQARNHRATSVRAIATSAARDALNGQDLINAVRSAAGLDLTIISGVEEARYAFRGVATDNRLGAGSLLVLDLGGGSTEMVFGRHRSILFLASYKIGTVRLLELLPHSDPPLATEFASACEWVRQEIQRKVLPALGPYLKDARSEPLQLVGTGGSATILGCIHLGLTRFDRQLLDGAVISADNLSAISGRLWSLPLRERRQVPGLPPERADVILTGAVIYEVLLEQLHCSGLRVSTRGLRYAAALDQAADTA